MGIQISGLLKDSAFDWKSVVDQLIAAESIPLNNLNTEKDTNNSKISALNDLQTAMTDLQDSLQKIRAGGIFSARTVSTNTSNNTWKSTSSDGAAIGTYTFAVQQLATKATTQGKNDISSGLAATSDVSGLTLATMRTATPITAGQFTVNGQQVTIATTDSLADVFTKISDATGGAVTGSYDPASDKISLVSTDPELVLGASNDTSNFFAVMKLSNNGTATATSSASLGTLKLSASLATSGLTAAVSGAGSFTINGVSISYNADTDSLTSLINRINGAGAGVTASYDSANDRVSLVNNNTGDMGMGLADVSGGMLAALGLTTASGSTFTHGKNALFSVNGGPTLTSTSNTLEGSVHGISGLSVTVNTQTTQTLQVDSDTETMSSAIQDFVDKYNAVQSFIDTNTKITITGGSVATSLLTDNREVEAWSNQLRALAFNSISGLTGTVDRLDDLGLDFDNVSSQLSIKDSGKLATALSDHPDDVEKFFLSGTTGFVSRMYSYLTSVGSSNRSQQSSISKANAAIDKQIETMQARLDAERERLTTAFTAMLDAQSLAQQQSDALENAFGGDN